MARGGDGVAGLVGRSALLPGLLLALVGGSCSVSLVDRGRSLARELDGHSEKLESLVRERAASEELIAGVDERLVDASDLRTRASGEVESLQKGVSEARARVRSLEERLVLLMDRPAGSDGLDAGLREVGPFSDVMLYQHGVDLYEQERFELAAEVFIRCYELFGRTPRGSLSLALAGKCFGVLGRTAHVAWVVREFETRHGDAKGVGLREGLAALRSSLPAGHMEAVRQLTGEVRDAREVRARLTPDLDRATARLAEAEASLSSAQTAQDALQKRLRDLRTSERNCRLMLKHLTSNGDTLAQELEDEAADDVSVEQVFHEVGDALRRARGSLGLPEGTAE